jgi:hypothetical protein
MKPTVLALVLAFAAAPAFAHNCPTQMRAIDAALPKASLSDAQMAEVKKLRAEGEALHKQGKHDESQAALGKAKGILGIK